MLWLLLLFFFCCWRCYVVVAVVLIVATAVSCVLVACLLGCLVNRLALAFVLDFANRKESCASVIGVLFFLVIFIVNVCAVVFDVVIVVVRYNVRQSVYI